MLNIGRKPFKSLLHFVLENNMLEKPHMTVYVVIRGG